MIRETTRPQWPSNPICHHLPPRGTPAHESSGGILSTDADRKHNTTGPTTLDLHNIIIIIIIIAALILTLGNVLLLLLVLLLVQLGLLAEDSGNKVRDQPAQFLRDLVPVFGKCIINVLKHPAKLVWNPLVGNPRVMRVVGYPLSLVGLLDLLLKGRIVEAGREVGLRHSSAGKSTAAGRGDYTNASISTRGQDATRLTSDAAKGQTTTAGDSTTLATALGNAVAKGDTTGTTLNWD